MSAKTLLAAIGFALFSVAAAATTITFGGLVGANGAPFTTYTESGFTVAPNVGSLWCEAHVFGNPVPSIFAGTESLCGSPTNTNAVTTTEGGADFAFSSVDIAANNGDTLFSIVGSLLGSNVFLFSGTVPGHPPGPFSFTTVGSPSGNIDQLIITLTTQGTSSNLDNIVLIPGAPLPEPGTIALVGLALVAGLASARRRMRAR